MYEEWALLSVSYIRVLNVYVSNIQNFNGVFAKEIVRARNPVKGVEGYWVGEAQDSTTSPNPSQYGYFQQSTWAAFKQLIGMARFTATLNEAEM